MKRIEISIEDEIEFKKFLIQLIFIDIFADDLIIP